MALLFTEFIRPIFMLFTIVLYILLVCVLFKGRKSIFNSSFYFLFASTRIADVLNLLQRVFMMDLTMLFFADQWLSLSNELVMSTNHLNNIVRNKSPACGTKLKFLFKGLANNG